jgi:hypothetical protein
MDRKGDPKSLEKNEVGGRLAGWAGDLGPG